MSEDPPTFAPGTEISAKFRGAFCEAKIKDVSRSLKCKVWLNFTALFIFDSECMRKRFFHDILLKLMHTVLTHVSLNLDLPYDNDSELGAASSEKRDRFVAQLYKFMDERGTPINKCPMIAGQDLDLYALYKAVKDLGGYARVSNKNLWKDVLEQMKYKKVHGATVQAVKSVNSDASVLCSFSFISTTTVDATNTCSTAKVPTCCLVGTPLIGAVHFDPPNSGEGEGAVTQLVCRLPCTPEWSFKHSAQCEFFLSNL
ncbi:unnamed protein product [Soboliphyme baturini]|uniref:ARID domain-containing protein n=1 Tax=Soboliphyme baturini TaxID=241478 RepID=A0A183IK02_9BILA|nr:unnamed protein product [Soboliphyme baturini]